MNRLPVIALMVASAAFAAPGPPSPSAPVMPPQMPSMPPPLPTSTVAPPGFTPSTPASPADVTQPPAAAVPAPAKLSSVKQDEASPAPVTIPQAYPRNRYEASWKKNPFLLKVAVIAQAKESWAKDFALTSIAKMGGTYRVGIKNKVTGESKRLTEGSDASAEFKIVSVNLKPDRKSSSVEVEKGGEKASLTYDLTMAPPQGRGAAPGQPPGMARPGMPVIPGQPGGNVPVPNMRTTSVGGQTGSVGGAAGNFQRPQLGGGAMPGYAGNVGGGFSGGYGGGGAAGSANTATAANAGSSNASTSRLGGLGPRNVASGGAQNSLVPMIGGTRYTGTTTGTTAGTDNSQINVGNVVTSTPDATGGATVIPDNTSGTTPVTRRRTLIPAPVVPQ